MHSSDNHVLARKDNMRIAAFSIASLAALSGPVMAEPVLQLVALDTTISIEDTDIDTFSVNGSELNLSISSDAAARISQFTSSNIDNEILLVVCWQSTQRLFIRSAIETANLTIALQDPPGLVASPDGSVCKSLGF